MSKVYWNSRRKCYSLKDSGVPVKHFTHGFIKNPKFLVREKTRQRVINNNKKEVHAFIVGEVENAWHDYFQELPRLAYNPYKAGHFYDINTDEPIKDCEFVYMCVNDDEPCILYKVKNANNIRLPL